MIGCLIITQEPLDLDSGTRETDATGMFLAWFYVRKLLMGKISKTVIYDQARVNGGSTLVTLGSQAK